MVKKNFEQYISTIKQWKLLARLKDQICNACQRRSVCRLVRPMSVQYVVISRKLNKTDPITTENYIEVGIADSVAAFIHSRRPHWEDIQSTTVVTCC